MNTENNKIPDRTLKQVIKWLELDDLAPIPSYVKEDLENCIESGDGDGYSAAKYLDSFCDWGGVDFRLAEILDGVFLKKE
jgi:hypothetical protein